MTEPPGTRTVPHLPFVDEPGTGHGQGTARRGEDTQGAGERHGRAGPVLRGGTAAGFTASFFRCDAVVTWW